MPRRRRGADMGCQQRTLSVFQRQTLCRHIESGLSNMLILNSLRNTQAIAALAMSVRLDYSSELRDGSVKCSLTRTFTVAKSHPQNDRPRRFKLMTLVEQQCAKTWMVCGVGGTFRADPIGNGSRMGHVEAATVLVVSADHFINRPDTVAAAG
jgi:hypothetical protein